MTAARDDAFWARVAAAKDVRQQLGERHMRQALNELQQAQNALARACAELCPIMGAGPEWKVVGTLHDRVKASWYRVKDKLARLRQNGGPYVDDVNVAGELEERDRRAAKAAPPAEPQS